MERELKLALQNQAALEYIRDNSNFENLNGIAAAGAATAQIMAAASKSENTALTIGFKARNIIKNITEVS